MEESYDVIVAGSGVAGPLAAAAAARGGAKTLLIDRNKQEEVGKKTNWGWVCGDAVAKSHIDFAAKELDATFSKPELNLKVEGVVAISPNLKRRFFFDGEGYSLDRPKFAKKLLQIALKQGVQYLPEHEVEGLTIENEKIVGVFGRDHKKDVFRVRGKIIIDSLGMATSLRRRLPPNEFIDRDVKIEDIESTGKYIMSFEQNGENEYYYDPRYALIHLNQELAPGGYGWVFPRDKGRINIGIGIEKNSLDIRNAKLGRKDNLHSLIDEYIRWNPIIKNPVIDNEDNNGKGYWQVAVRRQLESLVFNNYMGAGDSMAMPNPISAGGIGPAMVAGIVAGKVAAEAIQANNTSMEFLWKYNLEFNKLYGSKTAGLEVFRIYLQSLNNGIIDYGMENFLSEDEAVKVSYGVAPEASTLNAMRPTIKKVISGLKNLAAFRDMVFAFRKMRRLNQLYDAYPTEINRFKQWRETVQREINEVKQRFKVNPV